MGVRLMKTSLLVSRHTSANPSVTITALQSFIRSVTVCSSARRSRVSSKPTNSSVGLVCGSYHVVLVNGTTESRGNTAVGSSAQRSSFKIEYELYLFRNPSPEGSLLAG